MNTADLSPGAQRIVKDVLNKRYDIPGFQIIRAAQESNEAKAEAAEALAKGAGKQFVR